LVKDGGLGKLNHRREVAPVDKQAVIRLNRDTLYSSAVFDLDTGPVTVTLPDAGKRFLSMQVIDEDQYTHGVFYGAGTRKLTRKGIGTRYVVVAIRTLADPNDAKDIEQAHALQDAIKTSQQSPGPARRDPHRPGRDGSAGHLQRPGGPVGDRCGTPADRGRAARRPRQARRAARLGERLPAGSVGDAAIYTDHVKVSHIIRQVVLRQAAILNFVNPF
jgi:hypothetical protein